MKLMIALVGGQPLPNLLPIRYYQPDAVLFVYTDFTQATYKKLQAALEEEVEVFPLKTDAYNIIEIAGKLDQALQRDDLSNYEAVFNLTGGTKAMALAAYQVAQRREAPLLYLESEKKQSRIYHYRWNLGALEATESELLLECVTLADFLNIYIGKQCWTEEGPGRQEGSPFETALAQCLQTHQYEVMTGVKAMNGQIDLDVVIRYQNQFGIIEAKAGNNGRKLDGVKQLNNNMRQLGLYTQLFYAITVAPNDAHEALVSASKINIAALTNYEEGMTILTNDMATELLTIVDVRLKG